MTNHTPGPWMVSRYLYQDNAGYLHREIYAMEGLVKVAQTGKYGTEDSPIEANAQLIAAAPEMYAYLKSRADKGDTYAEALVEKAEGRK